MLELALARRRRATACSSAARSCRSAETALTPLLAREPLAARPGGDDGADRQRAARAAASGTSTRRWTFHGRAGHSARPWHGRQRDPPRGRGHRRARRARAASAHEFDGLSSSRSASVTRDRAAGSPTTSIPDASTCRAQLPLRAGPHARPRPRRGWPSCARRTACSRSTPTRRRARSPLGNPHVRRLSRPAASTARPSRRGRRWPSSAAPGVDAVNFGPGEPAQAHRRDEHVEIAALVRSYRVLEAIRGMKLSPVLTGLRTYPFVRLTRRSARLRGAAASTSSTSGWASRARRRRRFIREALVAARSSRSPPTRRATACRSCARRSRLGAGGASASALDPATEVVPTLGLQGGHLPPGAGARRALRRRARARLPGLRARRGVRRQGVLELPLREARVPARPRRGRRRRLGAVGLLWLNYPNNPTGATAPLALLRARPPRWRASTTSCSARDEAYSELYFGGEPPVSALQVADRTNVLAFNTLSKRSSMPGYRSGFVAGDPELIARAQALPAERRRRAAGVRPARGRGRLGRRGARRGGARALPAPSATCCCPCSRRWACATPAATRRSSCGSTRARTPTRSPTRLLGEAGRARRPRLVLRAGGRGLPAARARAEARRLRARRRAARPAAALAGTQPYRAPPDPARPVLHRGEKGALP